MIKGSLGFIYTIATFRNDTNVNNIQLGYAKNFQYPYFYHPISNVDTNRKRQVFVGLKHLIHPSLGSG